MYWHEVVCDDLTPILDFVGQNVKGQEQPLEVGHVPTNVYVRSKWDTPARQGPQSVSEKGLASLS